MTGLLNIAPPASNIGALLGFPEAASLTVPAKPTDQDAVPFLDLLWLFGSDVPLEEEDTAAPEDAPQEEPAQTGFAAPQLVAAPPRQIAEALIRSMLQSGVAQSGELQVEVPSVELASPISANESEDWDLPLEWIEPEELTDAETAPNLDANAPIVNRESNAPTPAPTHASQPPSPQSPSPRGVRTQSVAPQRKTEAPAPLAFALRLTAKESPSVPLAQVVEATPTTSVPLPATVPPESNLQVFEKTRPAMTEPATPSFERPAEQNLAREFTGEKSGGDDAEQQQSKPQPPVPLKTERETSPRITGPRSEPVATIPHPASPTASAVQQTVAPRVVIFDRPDSLGIAAPEASPHTPAEAPPSAETRPTAAREISVRISAPDAAPVDLHIAQRGGEVRVAVRAADAGFQTSLRQDLGTLVDRLEHSGFRAETLIPQEASSSIRTESTQSFDLSSSFRTHAVLGGEATRQENSQDSDGSGHKQGQPDSGARQQHQQRRQNSSQRFNWMKAMEDEV